MIHFHIVSLFPESIEPYMRASIIGRAQEKKKIKVTFYNPKDFAGTTASGLRDRIDRRPYGGGPGMVLEPEVMLRAVAKAVGKKKDVCIIFFVTSGEQFAEAMAQSLSRKKHIVLICGHYEGVDTRVAEILNAHRVSMGTYVLTGGELPAAVVVDTVSRFVPGVLGKKESLEASRVSSPDVYTRPEVLKWKGKEYRIPEVLKSGNHAKIDAWKRDRRV